MEFKVEYDTNNSGGDWWLEDSHWQRLGEAGWTLIPAAESRPHAEGGRWMGALHVKAHLTVEAETPREALRAAIKSWEDTVGMEASDEGCNCCGPPHFFRILEPRRPDEWNYDDTSASGDQIAYLMEGTEEISLREALRRTKGEPK